MSVSRTMDAELVKSICFIPEVWETIAEDAQQQDDWEPDMNEGWFIAEENDSLIGLFNLHVRNCVTLEIHPMILPGKRGRPAHNAVMDLWRFVIEKTGYRKIVCFVPTIYRNVKLFAMSCGMKEEGLQKEAYLKNGTITDQWCLGITKAEIEAKLNEQNH